MSFKLASQAGGLTSNV